MTLLTGEDPSLTGSRRKTTFLRTVTTPDLRLRPKGWDPDRPSKKHEETGENEVGGSDKRGSTKTISIEDGPDRRCQRKVFTLILV